MTAKLNAVFWLVNSREPHKTFNDCKASVQKKLASSRLSSKKTRSIVVTYVYFTFNSCITLSKISKYKRVRSFPYGLWGWAMLPSTASVCFK